MIFPVCDVFLDLFSNLFCFAFFKLWLSLLLNRQNNENNGAERAEREEEKKNKKISSTPPLYPQTINFDLSWMSLDTLGRP